MFSFSKMAHINSGMTGMARYNVWVLPIMLFYICINMNEVIWKYTYKNKKRNFLYNSTVCVIIASSIFVITYSIVWFEYNKALYTEFSILAEKTLNNFPQIYNPLPSTFVSRQKNVDGGYGIQDDIVVYSNTKEGYATKILTNSNMDDDYILSQFIGEEEDLEELERIVKKRNNTKTQQYLNLNNIEVYYLDEMSVELPNIGKTNIYPNRPTIRTANGMINSNGELETNGTEGHCVWGPYVKAKKGVYNFILYYDVIDAKNSETVGMFEIATNEGTKTYGIIDLEPMNRLVTVENVEFDDIQERVEYRVYVNEGSKIKISKIEIEKVGE